MMGKRGLMESIGKKIDKIALNMEKFKFVDYVYYIEHPRRMLFSNFMGGLARGFGIAIGFTLLSAVAIYLLKQAVMWNLPGIGKVITDIVNIVQDNLNKTGGKPGV